MCGNSTSNLTTQNQKSGDIDCSSEGCFGFYEGPEFINGSDVAHQFSNKMSSKVGDKLKELYDSGEYVKVDFSKIVMVTEGMGSGKVKYSLSIPFKHVKKKCEAFTSFDHAGGWNHAPALASRKAELQMVLLAGHSLDISDLKTTPEGLEEYWIQWKNKLKQSVCK